jgi:hypothetical protein
MPNSYVTYQGNGSTSVFNVPFPYINQSDVSVQVNGVTASFTWPTSSTVQINPAPANGATVYIFRQSNLSSPSVTWADGTVLRAADLNTEVTQLLYGVQEAWDQTSKTINAVLATTGNLPGVTTLNNGQVLEVVNGVWTPTTLPAAASYTFGNGLLNSSGTISVQAGDQSINVASGGINVHLLSTGGIAVASGGLYVYGPQKVTADPASSDGWAWYNSTNTAYRRNKNGVVESVTGVPYAWYNANPISNTTALTAASLSWACPANWLVVGRMLRVRFGGTWTATGTAANLTIDLFANGTSSGIDGATFSTGTSTAGTFTGEMIVVITGTGSGGTFTESGWITFGSQTLSIGQSSGAINTTIQNTFNMAFQWGTANASNSVTLRTFSVEVII